MFFKECNFLHLHLTFVNICRCSLEKSKYRLCSLPNKGAKLCICGGASMIIKMPKIRNAVKSYNPFFFLNYAITCNAIHLFFADRLFFSNLDWFIKSPHFLNNKGFVCTRYILEENVLWFQSNQVF